MVYMAGDNDLSMAVERDLAELRSVGSGPHLNLLAEFDLAGSQASRRIRIEKEGLNETSEELGETDSGSPETLFRFFEWCVTKFPADHYCLILWNHGGGWAPSEVDRVATETGVSRKEGRQLVERSSRAGISTLFRTSLKRMFSLDSPVERAICSDNGSGHSLDTLELGRVLGRAAEVLGRPLDIVGMDACLMGSVEVAYQLRRSVSLLITSQDLVPEDGWPYQKILSWLRNDTEIDPEDFAREVAETYVASYLERDYPGELTLAAFDLSCLDELLDPLERIAVHLLSNMPGSAPRIWESQRRSISFLNRSLWDLLTFGSRLANVYPEEEIVSVVQWMQQILDPGGGRFLLSRAHAGAQATQCGGLNVYLLPPVASLSPFYSELDFSKDYQWHRLLEAYHSVSRRGVT